MDDFLAHAIINPGARPELVSARALGLELGDKFRDRPPVGIWRARTADAKEVALVALDAAAPAGVRTRFAATATKLRELEIPGVLRVRDVSPRGEAFVADLWLTGTARDLPALRWPLRRRLELVGVVGEAVAALHEAGLVHGALTLDAVLLDDDLEPVVADVGLLPADGPEPDEAGDIAAFGAMIEEVAGSEMVPELAELVRKCKSPVAAGRPQNVKQVLAALAFVAEKLPTSEVVPVAPQSPAGGAPREAPMRKPTPPAGFRPTPVADKEAKAWPSQALLRGVGVAGIVAFAAAMVVGYFLGGRGGLGGPLAVVSIVGAAAATLLAPKLPRAGKALRLVLVVGIGAVVFVGEPVDFACRLGALHRMRSNPDARRNAVVEILRVDRDFRGAALSGLDLAGYDLTAADLRGADLSNADLSRARLWGAQLEGASLAGAKLAGADLEQSTLAHAINVGTATCDDQTRLPGGWNCRNGSPVP